ncbi:hypothetical protein KJ570_01680 [Patescibacteria group bacterium]|nr:hypothetical protein [Patescibacteria group bacterium]MBU2035861.1 hypothetical protein [Patescibacteria group bacterium]
MAKNTTKQKTPFIKKKAGPQLGYRTSDFFKKKTFGSSTKGQSFNPAQFKTQHKG